MSVVTQAAHDVWDVQQQCVGLRGVNRVYVLCMRLTGVDHSCAGASDIASQAQRADVVSDACMSMKKAARMSDRAALYI